MYEYNKAVLEDVRTMIKEYIEYGNLDLSDFDNVEEFAEWINDTAWTCDSVTGNASGSYTFNRYKAMEYVTDNMDLLADACEEFGIDAETVGEKLLSENWEWCDVTIRCYLLFTISAVVAEEYETEITKQD